MSVKKSEKRKINPSKKKETSSKNKNKIVKKEIKSKKSKLNKIKDFEFFEHTADVKFKAYGKNFSRALSNVAKATIDVMTDSSKIKNKQTKKIFFFSKTKESLVYDFVQKLIFIIDTEGFLTSEVSKLKIEKKGNEYYVSAELKGDNARNYDVHTCIKSATYNDMEITETKKNCTIQMVLDI